MIRRAPPPKKRAREFSASGAQRSRQRIIPRSLQAAYLELEALAGDHCAPVVLRGLSRVAVVAIHRILLIVLTGTDREVDAGGYLSDTIDTASRTSISLIESIDPLDTHPLTDGN